MRNIQAFNPSIRLLIPSGPPLLRNIVYLLHVVCVHLTIELLIIYGQEVVEADHVGKAILLLLLLWPLALFIEWSSLHALGGLPKTRIIIGIVHCSRGGKN